jgi:cellulose synthase operon protein C
MRRTGRTDRAAARRRNVLCFLTRGLSVLALGLATQTTVAQQTLQQQQAPGVVVQHPQTVPTVTRQPGQGTPAQSTEPLPLQQQPQAAPTNPPPAAEQNVDTTGIWFHLHQHDVSAAEADFTRLTQAHPRWKPPPDLVFALRSAEFDAAKAKGDAAEMRRLVTSIGSFDRCAHPDLAWGIAEIPGVGDKETLLGMARHCTDTGIAAGSMDRYLRATPSASREVTAALLAQQQWPPSVSQVLDGVRLKASLDALASGHPTEAQVADAEATTKATKNAGAAIALGWHYLNGGNATKASDWFSSAISWGGGASAQEGLERSRQPGGGAVASKAPQPGEAPPATAPTGKAAPPAKTPIRPAPAALPADAALAQALKRVDQGAPMNEIAADAQRAVELGKSDTWETVGWRLLDRQRSDDALTAFTRAGPTENAVFGRVTAAQKAGKEDEASGVACGQRTLSPRLAQACADSLASRQLAAYNANNFAEAEKLGDQLAEIAPDKAGPRALTAWSAYKTGDTKKAAGIFAELYHRNHDHDLANGLALSLRASGQTQVLRERAASDKTLGDIVAAQDADTAWYRKQFDLAATGPSPNPSLTGRSGWLVGTGMETTILADQLPGQGRFNALAGRVFAEGMVGSARLGFSLTGADIGIGTPLPDALIGMRPLPDRVSPTSGADLVVPNMTARWEWPDWTASTQLGLSPLNTAVGPLPTASASLAHYMDPVILNGRVFTQSVTNSLLSYGGMRDPVSGTAWGRVMDTGGSLQAIYLPVDRVSLSFTGEGAYLAGENVASNSRLSLRVDAAYDFRPENLDHLRVGPFVSFAHYERNLDFYTFGQGGYYSPDADTREGVLIDLLTAEGRKWQIEAKQSLAHGNVSEAASPEYPLSSSPLTFGGNRFTGIDIDTQLRGSVLVTDHLILSGFAGYSNAPGYKGYVAGLFVSIPFDARQGVFSTDLPDSTFRPFNVWR